MEWFYVLWGFLLGFSIAGWIMQCKNTKEKKVLKKEFDDYVKSVEEYEEGLNDMFYTVYQSLMEETNND